MGVGSQASQGVNDAGTVTEVPKYVTQITIFVLTAGPRGKFFLTRTVEEGLLGNYAPQTTAYC